MKDKELPLQAVYTVVPCFFVCCLTFYHYLIKILLLSLGILKSFPIFAVLFVDTLSKQRLTNVIRTFKT